MRITTMAIAAVCAFLLGSPVSAQNQNTKVVPIAFAKGQRCWRYAGTAPEFHGVFRAGQSLTVTSTGDSHYGDPAGEVIKTEERSVSVSLAHSPVFETHGTRADTFVVRQTGAYMFSINPAASWGYPQVFIVCTS